MKTIIENETKLSKYLLDDDTPVAFINGQIHVGDPNNLDFIIGDLSNINASLIENVAESAVASIDGGWVGNKFIYDGGWKPNPEWVEPVEEEEA